MGRYARKMVSSITWLRVIDNVRGEPLLPGGVQRLDGQKPNTFSRERILLEASGWNRDRSHNEEVDCERNAHRIVGGSGYTPPHV